MTDAVLFDMDGVLLDTERLKARAHSETITSFGGSLPPEAYARWMGRSQHEAEMGFAAAAGLGAPPAGYGDTFSRLYAGMIESGVETTPGARELLEELRARGYRVALVTSSLRWMMDRVLAAVGLRPLLDAVVCADDVRNEKPAPDAYLLAMELLGVGPERAVVVEDTQVGVAAGRAAGCPVIAVRHAFNAIHDFGAAARVLPGLVPTAAALEAIREAAGQPGA